MIGSPAFRDLVHAATEASGDHSLPDNAMDLMQQAVVGMPISDEIPRLHELISGPFDADKLDYMTRDAFMAGVPVVTDIPRLVQKVRGVWLSKDDVPEEILKEVAAGPTRYLMIGISHSGGRTLDELMLGRTLLFDKIYRHHKVRAIEAMVAFILVQVTRVASIHPALVPLRFTDEELLDLTLDQITALATKPLSDEETKDLDTALAFARRAKVRDLFVRCFAFSQRMPLDPYEADDDQRAGLVLLQRTIERVDDRGSFAKLIAEELRTLVDRVGEPVLEPYASHDLSSWIWLDPPESSRQNNVFARANLITDSNRVVRYRDDYAESKGWADAYLQARDVGYVFAPRELAPFLFLATEKVVREKFRVRTPTSMVEYAKQDAVELRDLRQRAYEAGYYESSPPDLWPPPQRLTRGDVAIVTQRIAERFRGYAGPSNKGMDPSGGVPPRRIFDWLRQFRDNEIVEGAVYAAESFRIIGRDELSKSLTKFVGDHPNFREAVICPLGEPKDSGYVNTYFAFDVATSLGLEVADLTTGLVGNKPIIFLDDFVGSGGQCIDIVEAWLGEPRSGGLGEERAPLATDDLQGRFRDRDIAFVFAAGLRAGEARLGDRLTELKLHASVSVYLKDEDLPTVFDSIYDHDGQRDAFLGACRAIGQQLLLSSGRADEKQAEDRLLGFGNLGLLVTFPYNTPAQTLTCAWLDGKVDGFDWLPLLPRRRKV
jgi:hypothetical protein